MAKSRAVIDIVASEAQTHQFLEEVRLLVAALRRTKAGQRLRAVRVAQFAQRAARVRNGFLPGRLPEDLQNVVRIHDEFATLGRVLSTDQRHGEALRMSRVVESIAPFDAQTRLIGRTVAPLDVHDFVVFDVIGQLTPHATIRAEGIDRLVGYRQGDFASRRERTRRAGLHAFAAAHASRRSHGIVHVEYNFGVLAAGREADNVVNLFVATRSQTARALNAGIEVDCNGRVSEIRRNSRSRRKARLAHFKARGPIVDFVVAGVVLLRHVRLQQLDDHLLRLADALTVRRHLHAVGRHATA